MRNPHFTLKFRVCLNVLLLVGLVFLARPVQAALLAPISPHHYVSTIGHDAGPCTTSLGACATINYAIDQAESGDTIHVAAGTYAPVVLDVDKDLMFSGAGKDVTILDGGGTTRAFSITFPVNTKINDLTLTHGDSGASLACGGGLAQFQGSLELMRVSVTGNTANCGAGIFTEGDIAITNSAITNNQANHTATSWGAGMYLNGIGTSATLTNVTISGNTANGAAGGMDVHNDNFNAGGATLTNVTISENTANANTALFVRNDAHVTIINSTIANNHRIALDATAGITDLATVVIKNSLLAGNEGANCNIPVGAAVSWTSQGNNIENGDSCRFDNAALNDHENTNPYLAPLANNGGLVKTMALLWNSPAIDGVTYNPPNGCPTTDARGISRPFNLICDIGAFEDKTIHTFLPLAAK